MKTEPIKIPATGRATYNLEDDRLKVWFDNRLSPEDYAEAQNAGFVWWPGSKCFSCVWRPQAEDFIARFGFEIEDTAEADDVAGRVERFSRYAESAEQTASRAADRLENGTANTERRQRLAEGVAAREFSTAEHWQNRIAGAIRHAQHREDAGAIMRRIETIETRLRKHQRNLASSETESGKAWAQRWINHLSHRIEYKRARLAATGDTRAQLLSNEIVIEKGGAVKLAGGCDWLFVTRLNPSTVEVYSPRETWRSKWRKVTRSEIIEVAGAAQVEAGEIEPALPPEEKVSNQPRGVSKTRQGETPEKFGAFKPSFTLNEDKGPYLITKINRLSIEYLTCEEYVGADKQTHSRFYIRKGEIYGLGSLLTAAQVKADHPQLLDDWAKCEEIKARNAARQTMKGATT